MRSLNIITWHDIKSNVKKVNPELANIINEIPSNENLRLIQASYHFGDLIISNGKLFLPTSNGDLAAIGSDRVDRTASQLLDYSPIPLFLTLKKNNEVFIDTNCRIIPLNLFEAGSLLGSFEIMDSFFSLKSKPIWSVSAGARSIFALPKISDRIGLKRLRRHFTLSTTTHLKHLSDHWEVFKLICKQEGEENAWVNDIIFFSQDWFKPSKLKKINQLKDYLYKECWKQAKFAMGKIEHGLNWEAFTEAISRRNLKPRPYLSDQIKHIMSMISRKSPGFIPVSNSDEAIPLHTIEKALLDIYQLKDYIPTLMQIAPLYSNQSYLYYSLSFPTLLEGSPTSKTSSTIITDLRDIKMLIDTISTHSKSNPLFDGKHFENIQLDYFHTEADPYGDIKSSIIIPNSDTAFKKQMKKFSDRAFCISSSFWKGCIRIKLPIV